MTPTKPLNNQYDLGLAYTPGVASRYWKSQMIQAKPINTPTKKSVAVVTNGTAILRLGNRGLASKPVMEGKGVLFKVFADIDILTLKSIRKIPKSDSCYRAGAPTFGGINLEDIKAPECFMIEQRLKELLDIPVFHDDQHGTAIILGASIINAMELTDRKPEDTKVVFSGAGASGISCANQLIMLGFPKENIWLTDSRGLVYQGRTDRMSPEKEFFANGDHPATLAEVMERRGYFHRLIFRRHCQPGYGQRMAAKPIIFPMANPDPEIKYELAKKRPDAIIGTGRSDSQPDQQRAGIPFIFTRSWMCVQPQSMMK